MKGNKVKYFSYNNDPACEEKKNQAVRFLAFHCEFTSSGKHLHINSDKEGRKNIYIFI